MSSIATTVTVLETGQGPISPRALSNIRPSPENDRLYRPVDPTDPEVRELAESIRHRGVLEPLVVTLDGFILSGHRRYVAAGLAGVAEVPCRTMLVTSESPRFLPQLREFNLQRVKSVDEITREEIVSVDPPEAHRRLREHRRQAAQVSAETVRIEGKTHRAKISRAKAPFLRAIDAVLTERRVYWPLTDRQVHYALLNDPPLIHPSKPPSRYQNNNNSYTALCELITRARLVGLIPFEAIHDPTRPVTCWKVHRDITPFVRGELDSLLKHYHRDCQQSQPTHIEIVGEKNTVAGIIRPIASDYCIPMTIGRGYCSLPPRHEMAQRFRRSGKEKLILLALSDFDPEGEDIAHSFARSMRDDFGITSVMPIKVALTAEQVTAMHLPPQMKAKKKSSRAKKFTERHGDDVFELEAVPPDRLQQLLRQAIDSVLDVDAYNREIDRERQDAADLETLRRRLHRAVAGEIGS